MLGLQAVEAKKAFLGSDERKRLVIEELDWTEGWTLRVAAF